MKITTATKKQAGLVGYLTICAGGGHVIGEASTYGSVNNPDFKELMKKSDAFFNVHGREMLSDELLSLPRLGCYNIHPYFYRYKGADPIGKMLKSGNRDGYLSLHKMTSRVDGGEVIAESVISPSGNSIQEVYNNLYTTYSKVISLALLTLREMK